MVYPPNENEEAPLPQRGKPRNEGVWGGKPSARGAIRKVKTPTAPKARARLNEKADSRKPEQTEAGEGSKIKKARNGRFSFRHATLQNLCFFKLSLTVGFLCNSVKDD